MSPSSQALLRSQAGPQAGAWLVVIPTEGSTCGPNPGCGAAVDALQATTSLPAGPAGQARPARSGSVLRERRWGRKARSCNSMQWLARRRLDLVVYGATPSGRALRCDDTLVSPLTRTGHPQACAAVVNGAALRVAERRNEQARTLSCGTWSLVRLKAHRARARVASTALGGPWVHPPTAADFQFSQLSPTAIHNECIFPSTRVFQHDLFEGTIPKHASPIDRMVGLQHKWVTSSNLPAIARSRRASTSPKQTFRTLSFQR